MLAWPESSLQMRQRAVAEAEAVRAASGPISSRAVVYQQGSI
ncbi:hypothetical protein [Methylomonas koyamae]|nr:hypothetical protein [Methylomonas koyamae]